MLSAELMCDRISSLKKANSAALARRRRSKRRIQKHRVLTKGAREDILAQNEADQQIAHEERQGRLIALLLDKEERDQASASGLKGAAPGARRPGTTRAHATLILLI
ncbi:predicted protein [Pyrenophora tritici-repentis Pt-1C-BFP]|uniref:Uncharacterized protein n=1 Tax=Pyrenophora tritici-repentis (strain Pt-1C-BFP) TaxID=426418 RepID=B2W1W3_PYRTR|nr:uncharacterized protein PTRG_03411 [Pyrenophora tritici-repentis Pt-1C-BFP]EDU46249.1 predicted protein [Pyrenophora tritici-repentis Pt-1C-BFP]